MVIDNSFAYWLVVYVDYVFMKEYNFWVYDLILTEL